MYLKLLGPVENPELSLRAKRFTLGVVARVLAGIACLCSMSELVAVGALVERG